MIHLAVIGAVETAWEQVFRRLRGVAIAEQPESADAILVLAEIPKVSNWLRRRKHVFVSMDAGVIGPGFQEFVDLAQGLGVRFGVVNPERYLPSRQLIRQHLDSGKLGVPGLIRIHRWEPNGAATNLLSDLDLILWYFGKTPNLVFAMDQAKVGSTQIHLGFEGGGMALVDHVRGLPAGDRYYSLSLIGGSGAAYADDHQNRQLAFHGGTADAVPGDEGLGPKVAMVQDIVDTLAANRDTTATVDGWRQVLAVCKAIERSLATRQAAVLR